jgi:hypothetical protein
LVLFTGEISWFYLRVRQVEILTVYFKNEIQQCTMYYKKF